MACPAPDHCATPAHQAVPPITDPASTAQAVGPEAPEDAYQAAREPLRSERQIVQSEISGPGVLNTGFTRELPRELLKNTNTWVPPQTN